MNEFFGKTKGSFIVIFSFKASLSNVELKWEIATKKMRRKRESGIGLGFRTYRVSIMSYRLSLAISILKDQVCRLCFSGCV
ncbi:hypothetical protein HanXRQr2_Chr03g0110461 [Helianthus annuus]|uniref:Uncharacterized protein n=1 Tax=Helianthus annuus TaxID=4232 RepID=A0A9K3NWA6_HELAN|nr:hypothetical protein HanXRQr2_Chr03g0110461 [Helianthus annuus]KAJ0943635.1 hypothetical protein HanPSC8_Chr03g0107031 [Helianthus annuus]